MIRAVIFDFDGVIVLSEQARFNALQLIARRYDLELKDTLFEKIIGRTTSDFFKHNFNTLRDDTYRKIMHDYQVEYKDRIIDHVIPIAFTNDFIRNYSGNKIFAIASGNDTTILHTMLKHLGLLDKFALIVGKEHVAKHKPDPEVYTYAAKKLGLKPEECLVVEDTVVGVRAANRAGMIVIALLNGVNAQADFRNVVVKDFASNLKQLENAIKP